MEKRKQKTIASYAIVGILILVFGFYSSTIQYAHAISVETIVLPAGATSRDVAWRTEGQTSQSAWIVGDAGGNSYVWTKASSSNTITATTALNGSTSARAIEYIDDTQQVWAFANTKRFKIHMEGGILQEVTDGAMTNVIRAHWHDVRDTVYACTSTGYYKIHKDTFTTKVEITNGTVLFSLEDCALDATSDFLFFARHTGGADNAVIKVDLINDQVNGIFTTGAGFNPQGIATDTRDDELWVSGGAEGTVRKYTQGGALLATVVVGTAPRFMTISDSSDSRHLYVVNVTPNTVSIIDIDANVVTSTQSVCDNLTTPIDDRRLSDTVKVYITCNSNSNSIIVDDSVSPAEGGEPDEFCDDPANANILICRLGGNSTSAGVGALVGAGITELGCNVIFVNCDDDTDPATNGLGLLIFIASIFVIIGMFYYTIGKEAFHMPIFIWVVIIIALSAFFTLTGIIDPVFLVLSVIAIISLGAPKIISIVRGSTFGGGSTA